MFRKGLLGIILAAGVAFAAPAHAAGLAVQFNPNGTGAVGAISIDVLDPTVGNSIAVHGFGGSSVGTDVTALFQANLGITSLGGVTNFTNGDNGDFFTIVAGFQNRGGEHRGRVPQPAAVAEPDASELLRSLQGFGNR